MYNQKQKYSILLNIFIIIFEIIGITIYVMDNNYFDFTYYTHDSNVLALISSSIYLVYILKRKEIPKWLSLLKYATILSLTITFLMVIFVLLPIYNFDYNFIFFKGSMLYFHIICPILTIVSFIFFEKHNIDDKLSFIRSMYLSMAYLIIILILNINDVLKGPYPFLMVKQNPISDSVIWILSILCGAVIVSKCIQIIKKKVKVD